jgi:small subunit ribosomal protein S2
MHELIEAGVHFGHKTRRWNPRMAPFIYGVRNDIHIIDLGKTVPMLQIALEAVRSTMAKNGRLLFVGTKRQAQESLAEAAVRSGQYYINHRWLGGLLTNWATIQNSIKTLRKLDEQLSQPESGFTKKELLQMNRDREKLESSLGGIKDMGGLPDMIFVIDTNKEDLAIAEAHKLGIPVVAIVDTNASYENITYPIPGNDDSTRAIRLYCQLVADAALAGLQEAMAHSGADLGAREFGDSPRKGRRHEPKADAVDAKEDPATALEAKAEESKVSKGRGGSKKAPEKKAVVVQVKKTPGKGKKADDAAESESEA